MDLLEDLGETRKSIFERTFFINPPSPPNKTSKPDFWFNKFEFLPTKKGLLKEGWSIKHAKPCWEVLL